jgi:two-component system NtrC family response regulator
VSVRILSIDDDPQVQDALAAILDREHTLARCADGPSGIAALRRDRFDLVFVDLGLPGADGFEVLRALESIPQPPPVVVLTATDTARTALEALRLGARDYLVKPAAPDEVRAVVARAAGAGCAADSAEDYGLLGRSPAMRQVHRLVPLLARSPESVLILGETGTGKELLARALHAHGPRRDGPFVAHNMAATPADLAETLFLGHVRGAFSGAAADHLGVFEQADGGTLFLDEIDSFPLGLQAKLLRVLESGRVQRVGATGERAIDVRVVAASPTSLDQLVRRGLFRADLYYRLRQLEVTLPPLRERGEDVLLLAEHVLAEFGRAAGKSFRLGPGVRDVVLQSPWPGNVRELRNALRSAATLAGEGAILPGHLPRGLEAPAGEDAAGAAGPRTLAEVEAAHVRRVLESVRGNQSLAARVLGIDRSTLARKLRQYGKDGAGPA